jgi:hypothetical protein
VENSHEAIIPRDLFLQVQEEMVRRARLETGTGKRRVYSGKYALSHLVYCAHCGDIYRRTQWWIRGEKIPVWRCISRIEKRKANVDCPSRTIYEKDMHAADVTAFNQLIAQKDEFLPGMKLAMERAMLTSNSPRVMEIDERLEALQKELLKKANGKKNCPHSKGIPEEVLESAFVESYRMITNDHKDVLEEFLQRTEEELHSDATMQEIERVKKELKQLDQKMQRLLDMHLEEQIDFGTYEDKKLEIIKEQQLKTTELKRLQGEADVEKDLRKRLDAMRKLLSEAPILKEFDRNVFESIVEKVIVGGYDDEGNADPSMITFVYKTGFEDKKKGDDYKPPRRNSKSKKLSSQPTDDSSKLSQQATDVACGNCMLLVPPKERFYLCAL